MFVTVKLLTGTQSEYAYRSFSKMTRIEYCYCKEALNQSGELSACCQTEPVQIFSNYLLLTLQIGSGKLPTVVLHVMDVMRSSIGLSGRSLIRPTLAPK